MTKWDLSQEYKDGLTSKNKLTHHIKKKKTKNHKHDHLNRKHLTNLSPFHDKNTQETINRRDRHPKNIK